MVSPDTELRAYEQARYAVPHNIIRSEEIYGHGFQSPGGLAGFEKILLSEMTISADMRVLDIGSGLGGAAFHVADITGAEVVGVDLSEVMVKLADERRAGDDSGGRVRFILGSAFAEELAERSFDVIYSRDSLLYEHDKPSLFARCRELLKPGGRLHISDFCAGLRTPEFEAYIDVSGYSLPTIEEYTRMLSDAGFTDVTGADLSELTGELLRADLARYEAKAAADPAIAPEDAAHVVERWRRKIDFIAAGALTQGLFAATAPAE
ncbi:methyltransferase domain-containing protein [Nocardia sp. CDC153]|uniref:methyltransferase domain-containing protein n=1 Tax=Nocardia sp. CDC153 TaxID=3112167 RepID=UPI002DB63049|nr:methyltransferase domain-containing protein [Nocardia sp. CDC153]MEC3952772.1 methyltransferase domain-containing protein [Nocardia sp. CDC153]